jgi:hypothetical protein
MICGGAKKGRQRQVGVVVGRLGVGLGKSGKDLRIS